MNPSKSAIIVHDPDPGGFRAGACLVGITCTLQLGYLAPGTVLRLHGREYVVVGPTGQAQRLELRR